MKPTNPQIKKNQSNKKTITVALVLFFSLFFALAPTPAPAQALVYRGTGGRPAYPREDNPRTDSIFIHTLEIGESQEDAIRVINNTTETKTLLVYPADQIPSSSGGYACSQLAEEQKALGAWIKLEKSEVTLAPYTNEVVPFTIALPETADVGENNGCIMIQEKKQEDPEGEQKAGVNLSFRSGVRVLVTVPGELKRELHLDSFDITPKDDGDFTYNVAVSNKGNLSTDAVITTKTVSLFGPTVEENTNTYTVLRNDTSTLNFLFRKPFWGGFYKVQTVVGYDKDVTVELGAESGNELTKIESDHILFYSSPKPVALAIEFAILIILVFIVVLLFVKQKRKNWILESWDEYTVKEGDDINTLAKHFDVKWKLLAKTNKLKPPYSLDKNTTIKVPPLENKEPKKEKKKIKGDKK